MIGIPRFNSNMLALARLVKGMSQTQLSNETMISQSKISRYESGIPGEVPSNNELKSLIKVLGYPEEFFFINDSFYPPATPLHRKRSGLGKKIKSSIEATANLIRIHINILENDIEVDDKVPRFEINEQNTPEIIAQKVRTTFKLPRGPIKNVTKVLEDQGIVILPMEFGTSQIDAFTMIGNCSHPIIFINNSFPTDRFRLSLGHELGHIVMHEIPTDQMEEEAWAFAAEFLAPAAEIKNELRNQKNLQYYAKLKKKWGISIGALIKRADDLNAIPENSVRWLWMQMSKYGYRTKEPVVLEKESPTLMKEIITVFKDELHYQKNELCSMLRISEEIFDELYGEYYNPEKKRRLRIVK